VEYKPLTIGVLALQGAFEKHQQMLTQMGIHNLKISSIEQLPHCHGLILPGGESTAMIHQIHTLGLQKPLIELAQTIPFFGTCAGMILMAGILNLIDITVERNAYGRQRASFANKHGVFIRAPRIKSIDSPLVTVLAEHEAEPISVQQHHHLACTFHPELTNNTSLHRHFTSLCTKYFNTSI